MIRTFNSGATRDTSKGKFEFRGFRHPLCEHSFGAYMHHHRKQADGSFRDSDNWWKGWDRQISLESLIRHTLDLEALHAGFAVYKERDGDAENTYYLHKNQIGDSSWRSVDEEECCNAIRFGSQAYLLEVLKQK